MNITDINQRFVRLWITIKGGKNIRDTHTYTHIDTYFFTIKKEILPFVTTWIKLEGIMLSEILDRERQILYDLTYMWSLKKIGWQKERVDW